MNMADTVVESWPLVRVEFLGGPWDGTDRVLSYPVSETIRSHCLEPGRYALRSLQFDVVTVAASQFQHGVPSGIINQFLATKRPVIYAWESRGK